MTRNCLLFAAPIVALALVTSVTGAAQDPSADPPAASRIIAPGESHAYPVVLKAGDWLRADVTQDAVDIVATLKAPDGHEVLSVDASNDEAFPETVVAIAEEPGTYTIAVTAAAPVRARGRYSIHIATPRPATDKDRQVIDAEREFVVGAPLVDRGHPAGWADAVAHFRKALVGYRAAGERGGEAKALFAMATVQYYRHDPGDLQTARESERIWRELGDRGAAAVVLDRIGQILEYHAEFPAALDALNEAIALDRETRHPRAELDALNDAALVYNRVGDAERAAGLFEQALALARATHDEKEPNILNNLGIAQKNLGEEDVALRRYQEALAKWRAVANRRGEMIALNNIGNLKSHAHPGEALKYYADVLTIARELRDRRAEAQVLNSTAKAEMQVGAARQALEHERASLAIREALDDVSGRAMSLEGIGLVLQRLGRFGEAEDALKQALDIRRRIGELYDEADSLLELAELARDRGKIQEAVEYAGSATDLDEQLRRRIADADLRASFRARGEESYDLLIDLLQRQHTRHAAVEAFDVSERARARVLLESVVESRIDRSRYTALPQPEPLTLAEIQQRVLDPATVLLEFALGKDHSWLWAVTSSGMVSVELPPRTTIDAAARKAYDELSARSPRATADAAALSRMLLGGIADRLRSDWRDKRLAIVPSGSLGYVPFAALPAPGDGAAAPLGAAHEIVMAPSGSVIAALRDEAARRPRARGAIAIVADPVFDSSDPRVADARPRAASAPGGAPALSRLSFSRAEADAIASFAPAASVLKETGFDATRASILGGALDDYRIVHVATHGIVDSGRPARSALVLSLVGRTGAPLDGYLRQRDIYTMRLDADLVVLSACQTAVGKEVSGEGLMGLTRAFMYAGTPRVIASLWEVGDRATAEFMTIFYRALLQQHLRPAAALRTAQIEMARNPRWSSPYYWAAFVLHGDWR